jgi:uncharacterized membrane protein YphA (DoxX/SURF4 family)
MLSVFLILPAYVVAQAPKVAGMPALRRVPRPLAVAMIRVTCLEAMAGALLIAAGLWPDLGALLVLVFLVAVTLTMHRFWEMEPSLARKQRQDAFPSNGAWRAPRSSCSPPSTSPSTCHSAWSRTRCSDRSSPGP